MSDLQGFNAYEVPERADRSFAPIPPGLYAVVATQNERKVNAKGTGEYLQYVLEVLDENYRGKKLWVRLNLWNPSPVAVNIAKEELGELCRAVEVPTPDDSAELLNIPFIVELDVEKDNRDKTKEVNKIVKYHNINATADSPGFAGKVEAPAATAAAAGARPKPVWPGART